MIKFIQATQKERPTPKLSKSEDQRMIFMCKKYKQYEVQNLKTQAKKVSNMKEKRSGKIKLLNLISKIFKIINLLLRLKIKNLELV